MQKIKYIVNYQGHKIGDVEIVSNNTAHGLIEKGVAILYHIDIGGEKSKVLEEPPVDKMMKPETKAERKARQRRERADRYQTK